MQPDDPHPSADRPQPRPPGYYRNLLTVLCCRLLAYTLVFIAGFSFTVVGAAAFERQNGWLPYGILLVAALQGVFILQRELHRRGHTIL